MKKRWLTATLLASLTGSSAFADKINHVAMAQFDYIQARQGSLDTDTRQLLLTTYLEEVSHTIHPHTQASFLERAASITLAYIDLDTELPFFGDTSGSASGIDIEYVALTHMVLGVGYNRSRLKNLSRQNTHTLSLGRYLDDTSRLLLTYANARNKPVWGERSNTYTYGIEYKNVTKHLNARALTLDMKANHIDASDGNSNLLSLQAEYHFNPATSVTGGLQLVTGHERSQELSLSLLQFLTPGFALGAGFTHHDPSGQRHSNSLALRARLLF
ncbi:hypothetical protein [Nitrincola sp. MINF-07-Sa-05]|uniref:hypothetical protein n=1 Tax=Nitrincola salilacus TaxID=3400273 RepID=UPI003917EDC5